jgi:hypothetical protein
MGGGHAQGRMESQHNSQQNYQVNPISAIIWG